MADAATVDLPGEKVYPLVRAVIGKAGDADPVAAPLLKLLDDWSFRGAHRRDLDGDNVLDESAAVLLMDDWWPRLVAGAFQPVLGNKVIDVLKGLMPFDDPANPGGSAYFAGWWGYVSKDLRTLLGRRVRGPYSRRYCGKGKLAACRAMLLTTLKEAAQDVATKQTTPDPAKWKRPATCPVGQSPIVCDQIEFTAAGAIATPPIPWQDRPTFQQTVEALG
jgi:hypothetical protein